MRVTRRRFLQGTGAGLLALSLDRLTSGPFSVATAGAAGGVLPAYRQWEDIYRRRWSWDTVGRSTHFVNCWYQAHCCWNVFLKDGIVWREEQAADYPSTKPVLPDFNPRGCQKGACYSERMYDASRLKFPLKRVGERGAGRWKRLSWQEALEEIADVVIDSIRDEGTDRIVWSFGPLLTGGNMAAGACRLGLLMDSVLLDMNTEIGDGHHGAAVTFGKITAERSLDDYFASEIILIWGCNPIYTQIPNSHFFTEARYHGARLVAISPDFNASAIHADRWVGVRPGTDAALALGMAQVIVEEGLYDTGFLREQTDLPFLVRLDTRRFLREKDITAGGSDEAFYVYDEATGSITAPPSTTLALGSVRPALKGTYEVDTTEGRVRVRPVFALLRERLAANYTPEQAAKITGTPAATIRGLARDIASAATVANVTSSNWGKFYHGNLIERAQILLLTVCGHMGKKGSGFSAFPFLVNDGFEFFILMRHAGAVGKLELQAKALLKALPMKWKGFTEEMVTFELMRGLYREGRWVSGTMFWNVHGGLLDLAKDSERWDPHLKRNVRAHIDESLANGWQFVSPPPGQPPRVIFEAGSNILRRLRGYPKLLEHLFPKLHAFVTLDSRMSSTGLYSDYVLPVTAWYERTEHKWVTPLMPFIHAGIKLSTFHEAKSDWEIAALLAKTIQARAQSRGISVFRDRAGNEKRFDTLYDQFTFGGTCTEDDEDKAASDILDLSTNLKGVEWDELKRKGYARFTAVGGSSASIGNACDIEPAETVSPFRWHTERKMVYPTLTRRIQFYVDQDIYLELGEELPRHKDPPMSGGDYPLTLTGGHTRWSIHASWRDDALMLRQQRGVPVMYMSVEDTAARGIADGDEVEVRNDIDAFRIHVKVSPAVRPGQVIIYHAWENHQFKGGKGFQNLIPSPINPVELAGGQFHLRPMFLCLQPGQSDRDTRVEVTKAA